VYFPWLVSDRMLESFGSGDELAKAAAGFADSWAKNRDAVGLAWRYKSSRLHDVAVPFGGRLNEALDRVTAAVLVMPVTTGRTHPIEMSESMSKGLTKQGRVAELEAELTRVKAPRLRGPAKLASMSAARRPGLGGHRVRSFLTARCCRRSSTIRPGTSCLKRRPEPAT